MTAINARRRESCQFGDVLKTGMNPVRSCSCLSPRSETREPFCSSMWSLEHKTPDQYQGTAPYLATPQPFVYAARFRRFGKVLLSNVCFHPKRSFKRLKFGTREGLLTARSSQFLLDVKDERCVMHQPFPNRRRCLAVIQKQTAHLY